MSSRLSTRLLYFAVALSTLLSVFVFPSVKVAAQQVGTVWTDLPNSISPDLGKATIPSSKTSLNNTSSVDVIFVPQNEAAFAALAQAVQNPTSPEYRHFISDAQYQQNFAPSQQVIDASRAYFSSQGLSIDYVSPDNLLMVVSGSLNQLDLAFNTVSEYHADTHGEKGYINVTSIQLPSNLARSVKGVVGFDKMHKMSSYASWQNEQVSNDSTTPKTSTGGSNTPSSLRTAYDVSNTYTGTGTTVGLTLWGAPNTTDLQNWVSAYSLPALNLVITPTTAPSSDDDTRFEANMDVQLVHTIAPGANKRYYIAADATFNSLLTVLSYAVNDKVNAITNSWGACEGGVSSSTAASYHTVFQAAAVQGTAVFFSSGDDGIFTCGSSDAGYTSFPSGDDLVTSAGASRLYRDSSTNNWVNETSWSCSTSDGTNDGSCLQANGGSSGGGITVNYSRPSYQSSITPPSEAKFVYSPTSAKRVEPDISMNGDPNSGMHIYGNYSTFSCGTNCYGGGTSAASPELAGVLALAAQKYGGYIGGINSFIYSHSSASWLFDVTSGYNGVNENTGWGYINGLGSLKDVTSFVNAFTSLSSSSLLLSSAPNPSVYGQSVVFTATVIGTGATPTGSVVFTDTTTNTNLGTANLVNGSAAITVTSLAVGSHTVTAVYSGDTTYTGSTATAPVVQVVNKASTATALSDSTNQAGVGQSVAFTATVSVNAPGGGIPSGTVTFTDNISGTLGTGTLSNGVATFSTSSLSAGQHNITATYGGDSNNAGSTSSQATVTVSSSLISTNITLTSGPNPSMIGQAVTFTATVSPASGNGTPTGSVTFSDNISGTLGMVSLNNGVATYTTSNLSQGAHTITANYSGDSTYSGNSISTDQTVSNSFTTTTALVSAPNPSTVGQSVTFMATVSGNSGTPSGTVTFNDSISGTLGTATLSNGVATLSTSSLVAGTHVITATYAGNSNYSGSSGTTTQTVNSVVVTSTNYTYYLPFVANNASDFTTYLAFQNVGSAAANVNITFFNSSGVTLTAASVVTQVAKYGEAIPTNPFASGSSGAGIITSDQPLSVIVPEATPYGGSAYAVASGSSNNLIAPFALNNAFGDFTTQLNIFNGGATSATANVTFYGTVGSDSTLISSTTSVNVGAHQTTNLNQNTLPSGFSGWAQISGSTSNLVAQVLEQSPNTKFVAIANAVSNPSATEYAPAIFNKGYGAFYTGANVINPNANPVTVTVTYYDLAANSTTTTPFVIPAHGVASIYNGGTGGNGLPSGGLPSSFIGSMAVSAVGGNIAMSVNENGGLTAAGNSRSGTYAAIANGGSTVGLPVVSNGGFTYITGDTILNTSSQSVTATITYYNVDGTAVSGASKTFTIAGHGSQAYYQGDGSLSNGFYGTAVITQTGGPANSLIATTNAQNVALFYTYSEPNS